MKEIIDKVAERLEKVVEKDSEIDETKFKDIVKEASGKIAFIDGGQAEILKAVDFSLQFIRIACIIFEDNKKIESEIREFFIIITSSVKDSMIMYDTEILPVKGDTIENISIDSFDKSIIMGKERGSVSQVGGMVRRFSELNLAADICSKLAKGDCVVIDGCLKSLMKGEKEYIDRLKSSGDENSVKVAGLAKTSSRFFEDGNSVLDEVSMAGKENVWKYFIGRENDYDVSIVKLHPKSNYVFELNCFGDEDKVLGNLVNNSKDPVFLGYPYGLISVDRIARVSNQEKEHLMMIFKTRLGKKWKKIEKSLHTQDSHSILDNIG